MHDCGCGIPKQKRNCLQPEPEPNRAQDEVPTSLFTLSTVGLKNREREREREKKREGERKRESSFLTAFMHLCRSVGRLIPNVFVYPALLHF